jgi:hypothetical protein
MTLHISRDFPSNNSSANYASNASLYVPYIYTMAIFLNKILGYTVVGQTGFDINNTNSQTFTFANTTPITAASNGQTLPQATINVTSTTGFPASGIIYVGTSDGTQIVRYSGTTATTFTNCTGGTGTMTASSATTITAASNGAVLPQATINVAATATASTTIAAGSNGVSLPTGTINVASNVGFPTSGTLNVTTGAGVQTVTYTGLTGTTQFTGCAGGTGTMSTGGAVNNTGFFVNFATSGTIYVMTTAGPQIVAYTGKTATTFTGCTGGTGTMSTGNTVTSTGGSVTCGPNKILTATGAPPLLTTTFPHGMVTGEYAGITAGGVINIGNAFSPYPVEVVSPTQLKLTTSAGGLSYTANTQSLLPQGFLIASGSVSGGTGASINFGGAPSVYAVQIPAAVRTVVNGTAPTAGDTGRILVIKSSSYPTKNTGIYKISTVNTATNSYTIDYRSTDTPPPESGALDWWLYETEFSASNVIFFGDYNRFSYGFLGPGASNTSPIQVTYNINTVQYFKTGQKVNVSGVLGNTAANGTWTITVNGANTVLLNGSAGNGTYTSGGLISRANQYIGGSDSSVCSRILLQSPHPSGWQVRICNEMFNNPITSNYTSVSLGYGGSVNGDFPVGGVTTLPMQFLDFTVANDQYRYTIPGSANPNFAPRLTMVGDDTGQSVFILARPQGGGTNGLLTFGIPDNEPAPLQPNSNRIFVYGGCNGSTLDYGGLQMKVTQATNAGFSFRDFSPEMCAIAGFVNADGVSGTSPVYSANAGDCPFTGTTEVVPWEVWAGVLTDSALNLPYPTAGSTVYSLNQRFMGTAPYIRQGRTNFGTFALSTDNTTSSSVSAATNTSPIQITTSATNSLVTGQTVIIFGVGGNTAANGTFVITVIDNTHFTLNGSTGNGTYTSGGTINGTPQWLHLQNGIYLQWNGASGLTP